MECPTCGLAFFNMETHQKVHEATIDWNDQLEAEMDKRTGKTPPD